MRHILLIIISITTVISLSCSKVKDIDTEIRKKIVGAWKVENTLGSYNSQHYINIYYLVFLESGFGIWEYGKHWETSIKWDIKDGFLNFNKGDDITGKQKMFKYRIEHLTDKELILLNMDDKSELIVGKK